MTTSDIYLFAQYAYERRGESFNGFQVIDELDEPLDGFYGVALQQNDQIIISYRGTDDKFADILNGWTGAVGLWTSD